MKRILKILAIGVVGLCLLSVFAVLASGPSRPTQTQATPVPIALTQSATAEVNATATIAPSPAMLVTPSPGPTTESRPTMGPGDGYASGGLGLNRADFAARYGESTGKALVGERFASTMDVSFIDGGRAWIIFYNFPKGNWPSLSDSEAIAKTLLPADAELVQTYIKDEVQTVRVFISKSLAQRFKTELFADKDGNVTPGTFIVQHHIQPKGFSNAGQVSSLIVSIGNNP